MTSPLNSRLWQSQPTYRWEFLVAGVWLSTVTLAATDWHDPRHALGQVISMFAVLATFGHMSVASRLEEAQDRSEKKTVECYQKLSRYLILKESLWLIAFLFLHAWTALAGIPLFLFYPSWRRLYRRLRPSPGE